MASHQFGVVVAGVGRMGTTHIKNVSTSAAVRLLYVVDVDVTKAQEYATSFGAIKGACTLESALLDAEVEVVVVATPTVTHVQVILQCLEAGKHVFCEKPISLSMADVDRCFSLAKEKGLLLACGYQRRYDPSFKRIKTLLKSGQMGRVHSLKITSRDSPLPPASFLPISGGFLHDMMTHDVDMVRYLTGEEPTSVYCVASTFLDYIKELNDFDNACMVLTFASGVTACISTTRLSTYGYDQRVELNTDKGMIEARNPSQDTVVISDGNGETYTKFPDSFNARYIEAYRVELDAFFDMLKKGLKEVADGFGASYLDIKQDFRVIEAGVQSIAEKRVIFL